MDGMVNLQFGIWSSMICDNIALWNYGSAPIYFAWPVDTNQESIEPESHVIDRPRIMKLQFDK